MIFPLHQTTCFFITLVAPCTPLLAVANQHEGAATDFISDQNQEQSADSLTNAGVGDNVPVQVTLDENKDSLYYRAVDVVVNTGMASVSMLQHRLKLGYSHAAQLLDQMEEAEIAGLFQGAKPREVLLSKEV